MSKFSAPSFCTARQQGWTQLLSFKRSYNSQLTEQNIQQQAEAEVEQALHCYDLRENQPWVPHCRPVEHCIGSYGETPKSSVKRLQASAAKVQHSAPLAGNAAYWPLVTRFFATGMQKVLLACFGPIRSRNL